MNEVNVKQAFKEVEQELSKAKVEELKGYIRSTLTALEQSKEVVKQEQEKQRIYKLDIEDLRKGNITSIEERQKESPMAKQCSKVVTINILQHIVQQNPWFNQPMMWTNATSGTYAINLTQYSSTGTTTKSIYLG